MVTMYMFFKKAGGNGPGDNDIFLQLSLCLPFLRGLMCGLSLWQPIHLVYCLSLH